MHTASTHTTRQLNASQENHKLQKLSTQLGICSWKFQPTDKLCKSPTPEVIAGGRTLLLDNKRSSKKSPLAQSTDFKFCLAPKEKPHHYKCKSLLRTKRPLTTLLAVGPSYTTVLAPICPERSISRPFASVGYLTGLRHPEKTQ